MLKWRGAPRLQAMSGELKQAEELADDVEGQKEAAVAAVARLCTASQDAFHAAECDRNPLVQVKTHILPV